MNQSPTSHRLQFTLAVTAFAILHLSLEFFTGGVRVHYPLMREDLPALSNWWGLILLPALAWFSHAYMPQESSTAGVLGLEKTAVYRLISAFIYGAALSASFEFGLGQTPLFFLLGLLLGGIFLPLYRFEIILGLILGMTYTFGAVIPTVAISLVALTSLLSYNAARFVTRKIKHGLS
jgi:hypothetical protein